MSEEIWVQEDGVKRKLEGAELEAFLADRAQMQVEQEAREAEEAAKVAAKQSALSKLSALGLTDDEISALVGA